MPLAGLTLWPIYLSAFLLPLSRRLILWATAVELNTRRVFFSSTICGLQVRAMTCNFALYAHPSRLAAHTGTHRLSTAMHSAAHTLSTATYTDVLCQVVAAVDHVLDGVAAPRNGDGLPRQRKAVNPCSPTPDGRPHVLTSVRGCICNSEAGGSRRIYELSMMAQVSNGLVRNQALLVILGLVVVLVIGGGDLPAVWSGKKTRRTAALDVLDRIPAVAALTPAGQEPCRAGWTPGGTSPACPCLARHGLSAGSGMRDAPALGPA